MSRTVTWQRIPTPVAPMILLEYKWEGGMFLRASDDEQMHESHIQPEGCDIRFRFHYSKDSAVQAKSAAAEIEASLIAQGAMKVKLDPVPIPTESTRSLEIVKASTLTEQARLLWKKWDLKITAEEESILTDRIEEIQTECGFGQRLTLDAGIHVKSTRMKGWRCFADEVKIDFDAIEGEVIAVSGPNGTGKSLYWELAVLGALYREVPTHGKIGDHAIARDTFVETNFEYAGQDYTVSQIIDGKDNSGSTSLKVGTTPVFGTETALRTQYDKWVTENLPPLSLVTSTTFMPQESKGILGMGATARKSLILKAKGVERYEVLAEAARKRAGAVLKEMERSRARLEEIGEVDINQLREIVSLNLRNQTDRHHDLASVEMLLKSSREEAERVEKQRVEYAALVARRAELDAQVTALRSKRDGVLTRIEVGKELTDEKVVIEKAIADVAELETKKAAAMEPASGIDQQYATASGVGERLRSELGGLRKRVEEGVEQDRELARRLAEIETKIGSTRAIVADSDKIRAAVIETENLQASLKVKWEDDSKQRVRQAELAGELRDLRARWNNNAQAASETKRKLDAAQLIVGTDGYLKAQALAAVVAVKNLGTEIARKETTQSQYWTEIEALQLSVSTSSETRINGLRGGLTEISNGLAEPAAHAMKTLSADEDLEGESIETPGRLQEVRQQWRILRDDLQDLRDTLAIQQKDAAKLPEIEAAETTIAETLAALEVLDGIHTSLTEESNQVIAKQDALESEMRQTQADIRWLNEQIEGLEPLVARGELLATAEAKTEEYLKQAVVIEQDQERLTAAGAQLLIDIGKLEEQATANADLLFELMAKKTAILAQVEELDEQIEALKPSADKAHLLAVALAAAEELLHQLSGVDAELESLEHNHAQVEHQVDEFKLLDTVDVPTFEKRVADARAVLSAIQTRLTLAEKELTDAEAKERRRQELATETKRLEKAVDRWNLIERTVGRDGLIAESVAAVSDEINEYANTLLRASGNTKYTIDLKTTKTTKDGKKEIEGCPINVYNSETGEWQEGSTLSPGQRAFVNLPIALSLAKIGCQDSSVRPTIYIDEPTAALDPIARIQFLSMLRHVAQDVNASKIFCVMHNEELIALCDGHMEISGGAIHIT